MRLGIQALIVAALALALLAPAPAAAGQGGTPKEMVATYSSLADGILALKRTEEDLVRSILAATAANGHRNLQHALMAVDKGDGAAAKTAVEALAADVGQLATEGDNAVGAIRKRLLEGGHHHNAAGEAQGIYDEGYVIVTRAAKAKLLASSRAIAGMAGAPKAEGLKAEWKKVEAVVAELIRPSLPPAVPRRPVPPTGPRPTTSSTWPRRWESPGWSSPAVRPRTTSWTRPGPGPPGSTSTGTAASTATS
jgi:hypothetical protein